MTKRILSGMQPTGQLHLGNYLGALRNWVKLQDEAECFYCMVDLHAITVPQDPAALRASIRSTAAAYIAAGVDPIKSTIFPQSAVRAHTELGWIFNTLTPLGWLERMTQFKDKTGLSNSSASIKFKSDVSKDEADRLKQKIKKIKAINNIEFKPIYDDYITIAEIREIEDKIETIKFSKENSLVPNGACLGLFSYPVLMAADILVYKATHVPVGEDQKQHLELTRDLAGAFNRQFGVDYFGLPEPQILGEATRVMSLRDGSKKMSKSDESDYSRINLTDDADTIALKFRKAKTDSDPLPDNTKSLEARPAADNLGTIYAALTDTTKAAVLAAQAGAQFSTFKKELTEIAVTKLAPISERLRELQADTTTLDNILRQGAERASALADKHINEVKDIVGLWRYGRF